MGSRVCRSGVVVKLIIYIQTLLISPQGLANGQGSMFSNRNILIIFLVVVFSFSMSSSAPADIRPDAEAQATHTKSLFEKYWEASKIKRDTTDSPRPKSAAPAKPPKTRDSSCPGMIVGQWDDRPDGLFREQWPYRNITFEMYFPEKRLVARTIYGLALFTRDLDPSVTLARFERGAGGFHYSIDQVADWANAVETGAHPVYTQEEKDFLNQLVDQRLLLKVHGRFRNIGLIRHVLGVTPMRKRSLALNLRHERTHILWDEAPGFRDTYTKRWRTLSDEEKKAVYARLKGYNPENEMQIIEEWAVYQNEDKPVWK